MKYFKSFNKQLRDFLPTCFKMVTWRSKVENFQIRKVYKCEMFERFFFSFKCSALMQTFCRDFSFVSVFKNGSHLVFSNVRVADIMKRDNIAEVEFMKRFGCA